MTFRDYLQRIDITEDTRGREGIVYAVISACKPDITYREASLLFADLSVIGDTFEALWYAYEDTLDRMNYHKEQHDLVPVSVIIDEVVEDLQRRCSNEAGND